MGALAHAAGALARVAITGVLVASGAWLAWNLAHVPSEISYSRSQADAADAKAADVAGEVSDAEASARASSRSKSCAAAGKAVASAEVALAGEGTPRQDLQTLSEYGIDASTPWVTRSQPSDDGASIDFLTTTGFDGDSIPVAWSCTDDMDGHALAYVTATWDVKAQAFSGVTVWRTA